MSSSEELVQLATINFQNKNYKDCIIILKELLKSNSDDPKILHNLAVAEYYYKQEKKQKEALNEILQKTINENKEIIDNNKLDIIKFLNDSNDLLNNFELNGYLTSQKNKEIDNEIVSQNQDNSEKSLEKESVNELDLDLADNQDDMEEDSLKLSNLPLLLSDIIYELYNTSVIYFNERKYKEAVELLEPSFSNIEALDDYIALKISFLLIDLYLELGNSEKAIAVLELSQKIYKRNIEEMKCMENEDGDSSINSSLKDIDHSSSKSDIDKNEYNDSNVSSLSLSTVLLKNINITSPDIKAALPSKFNTFNAFYYYQKARINIKNNELDEAKKNMELSLRINQNEPLSVEPINEEEMVAADFMSSNGSDKDKKEMGEAQNNYYQLENVINNLNATLAYNDENMKESFSLLASQPRGEDYIYNNLGCVSYQEKKYSLAENFFLKALKENEQLLKEQQLKGQIEENDQEEDKKQENQTEQQLEQSTEQDQNGKQTEEDKESLIENKTSDEYKIKKLPSILHNLELQYMIHNNFEMAIKCLLQDRRQDKNDTISLENIFYWLRAGEIFLRIYRNKTYSTDPKNIMKVYRISPEIIYGFINNKARTISPLGEDNEFKELNKITNFSNYQLPETIPEEPKELLNHSFKCFQKNITLIEKLRLDSLSMDGLSINEIDANGENRISKPSQSLFTDNELKILMDILKLNVAYIYLEYKQYDLVLTMLNDFLLVDVNDFKNDQNDEICKTLGVSPFTLYIIAKIYISQALIGFKLYNEAYNMISTNVIPKDTPIDPNIKAILFLCQASTLCWSVYGQQNIQEKILTEAELSLKRFYILAYSYLKNDSLPSIAIDNDMSLPPSDIDILAKGIKSYEPSENSFVLNAQSFLTDAKMIQTWIDMKRKDYESALIHLS